jgi:hypothetical protein
MNNSLSKGDCFIDIMIVFFLFFLLLFFLCVSSMYIEDKKPYSTYYDVPTGKEISQKR